MVNSRIWIEQFWNRSEKKGMMARLFSLHAVYSEYWWRPFFASLLACLTAAVKASLETKHILILDNDRNVQLTSRPVDFRYHILSFYKCESHPIFRARLEYGKEQLPRFRNEKESAFYVEFDCKIECIGETRCNGFAFFNGTRRGSFCGNEIFQPIGSQAWFLGPITLNGKLSTGRHCYNSLSTTKDTAVLPKYLATQSLDRVAMLAAFYFSNMSLTDLLL